MERGVLRNLTPWPPLQRSWRGGNAGGESCFFFLPPLHYVERGRPGGEVSKGRTCLLCTPPGASLHLHHLLDPVPEPDLVQHLGPGHHLAEDRVTAIEMRLGREGDEELAAAGVGAGEGHADGAAVVAQAVDIVSDGVARTAAAVPPRIAALDDEVGDHPVEGQTVVEALPGELQEAQTGEGRLRAGQPHRD